MIQKIAFKMHLNPGCKAEYKKRHKALWSELRTLLHDNGISDYTIFLDEETHTLFAVQRISGSRSSQDMIKNEIIKKWWCYMADIMQTNKDHSPVTRSLIKVFHMD